ncbi:MAG: hypothetical protein HY815_17280 [Candidatus Riflebacteria bacterium]|nr:hypothetical protein [Candidatus Riflebacteria bacterium]
MALVLLLAVVSAAVGQQGPPRRVTLLGTDQINLPGALQKVAREMFRPPMGTVLSIEKEHEHWRINDSVMFEKYRVTGPDESRLGQFVRMRSFGAGGTRVDLALQIEKGTIVAARPIQPVVLRGRPLADLPEILVSLSSNRVSEISSGVSCIFDGLQYLDQVASGPVDSKLGRDTTMALAFALFAKSPPLEPGTRMPHFTTRDERGSPVEPAMFRGQTTVLLAGTLLADLDRRVFDSVHRWLREHPSRFRLVELVQGGAPFIASYRRRGGKFEGLVVPDQDRKVFRALHGIFTPHLFVYGPDGVLARHIKAHELDTPARVAAELSKIGEGAPAPVAALPDDRFDPVPSLVKIAGTLYPESAPATVTVTRVKTLERFLEGFRYETYGTVDAAGKQQGELVRVQAFPDARSTIDFAVRVADGKVVGMEPVRPIRTGGVKIVGLPVLFKRLERRAMSQYAGGLADVFRGLALLEEGAAGPLRPPPRTSGAAPLLVVRERRPVVGDHMPEFSVTTLGRADVSLRMLKGRPLVVVVADVRSGLSRDMLHYAAVALSRRPQVVFLPVLNNREGDLSLIAHAGVETAGWLPRAVLDFDGGLRRAFAAPMLPYMILYDKYGHVVGHTYWKGTAAMERDLAALGER